MNGSMKASVLGDVSRIEVSDVPGPVVAPNEGLVRGAGVGL